MSSHSIPEQHVDAAQAGEGPDAMTAMLQMSERAFAVRDRYRGALIQIRAVCEDNPNMATNFIDEIARIALENPSNQ